MTDEITPEQREERRQLQRSFLQDEAIKDLYAASSGKDVSRYGEVGKSATQQYGYLKAMSNPTEGLGRVTSQVFGVNAQEALQSGRDPYETAGVTPVQLLNSVSTMYQQAVLSLKVSDVLDLMGIENVHSGNISDEQKDMYFDDFAEQNGEMAQRLMGSYLSTVASEGVGQAMIASSAGTKKGLEGMLSQDPNPQPSE